MAAFHPTHAMAEHNLQHTISLLTQTPAALDTLLRDLPESWTARNEGESTSSPFDIVGHLADCESVDWMHRVRQFDKSEAFKRFDRYVDLPSAGRRSKAGSNLGSACNSGERGVSLAAAVLIVSGRKQS